MDRYGRRQYIHLVVCTLLLSDVNGKNFLTAWGCGWRCDKGERFYVAYGGLKIAIILPPPSDYLDDWPTGELVTIYY